eukprot:tig00020510_g9875.t1
MKEHADIVELLREGRRRGDPIRICAPMVRYSKLAFRNLVRRWGCELAYTPMIIAASFLRSQKARDCDFTTNEADRPLVAQFATNDPSEFASCAEQLVGYADAIDLNCGCPQRWALQDGIGASLLRRPELIRDMVRAATERSRLPVTVKIRLDPDLRRTVELVQVLEKAGVAWLSVHGRTVHEASSYPVKYDGVKLAVESVSVPVVGNGNVFTLQDGRDFQDRTGVHGVMAARGLLQNPALFSGHDTPPLECALDFLRIATELGTSFTTTHTHLMFMLLGVQDRHERREFNSLRSLAGVVDFFRDRGYDPYSVVPAGVPPPRGVLVEPRRSEACAG